AKARAGIHEAEAEKLYAEAAELFKKEQLFDVKPLVEKLKSDYAQSRPVTDAARNPTFADLEQSTANLGRFITVRQDGKGDFTTIQAAIAAAPPNSLIEIQDNGPYNEKIGIQQAGLTIRGKAGCWPIITSVGPVTSFAVLVSVAAPRVSMERVVLSHGGAAGSEPYCVVGSLTIRSSVLDRGSASYTLWEGSWEIDECVIIGPSGAGGRDLSVRNSVWLGDASRGGVTVAGSAAKLENLLVTWGCRTPGVRSTMRYCTIGGLLDLGAPSQVSQVTDSIVQSVQSVNANTVVEHCNVYGNPPFIDAAKPGKGCFSADPQFRDPANLDYRLLPTSPCLGKASDGGDIGCRFTPEMIQMLNLALELRAKGIIKF
ncbi:MAG: hypothetical protein ABIK89_25980, partial [Planctomycetota bacterium]